MGSGKGQTKRINLFKRNKNLSDINGYIAVNNKEEKYYLAEELFENYPKIKEQTTRTDIIKDGQREWLNKTINVKTGEVNLADHYLGEDNPIDNDEKLSYVLTQAVHDFIEYGDAVYDKQLDLSKLEIIANANFKTNVISAAIVYRNDSPDKYLYYYSTPELPNIYVNELNNINLKIDEEIAYMARLADLSNPKLALDKETIKAEVKAANKKTIRLIRDK